MLLLLWQTGISGYAQECNINITGIVKDSSENLPLSFTIIEVVGRNQNTVSDKNGAFKLNNLCADSIEIHVTHLNCEHIHLKLYLRRDTSIVIFIKHQELELPQAKVVTVYKKAPLNIVSTYQIERNRGSSISSMMTELGGVSLLKSGAGIDKPMVNGLHSSRVLIINNGIRQEGQNWGAEHAPEIDAFLATDIMLIKGVRSLRYGSDGIGGVIMVLSPSIFLERSRKISGVFNGLGTVNGRGGIVSGYLGSKYSEKIPLYYRIQGTYKNVGSYSIPGYNLANTGIRENNYSAHLGFQKSRFKSELFYSQFNNQIGLYPGASSGNLSDLQSAMSSSTPLYIKPFSREIDRPYQNVKHQLLKFRNEWHTKKEELFEFIFSYQKNHREEYDILRSANAYKGPAFNYYINTYMGEIFWKRYYSHNRNLLSAGVVGLHQNNAYTGKFFIPGFYQNGLSQYFMLETDKLGLDIALRNDFKWYDIYLWNNNLLNINSKLYAGPSYALDWYYKFNKRLQLILSNSYTWRAPAPNELFSNGLHQALASIEKGDSTLKKEKSFNFSANIIHKGKKVQSEFEVFSKNINGYINLIPDKNLLLTIRGAFPVFRYVQTNALLYGVNGRVHWQFYNKWSLKLKTQVLYGRDISNGNYLNMMPPVNGQLGIYFNGKLSQFDLTADCWGRQNRYTEASDFLAPPPGYILIGGNWNQNFKFKKQRIIFSIGFNNLLNTRYRSYLNRLRYYTDEQGRQITFKLTIPIYKENDKH